MPMVRMVFLVLALISFLVGTVNVQPPGTRQINWTSAGLALLVLAYFVGA
jgi:ABC-type uncharacterized transport system permease subunit